jgi:AsmA protein
MNKIIKFLLLTLTTVVLLAGLAAALVFMLVDPSRYKPAIESVFAEQTGLNLNLAGDIAWTFSPVFGLSLQDVRLSKEGGTMELASLRELAIKIEPKALLDGHLAMQQFLADGLHVNWLVDADGISNWQLSDTTPDSTTATATANVSTSSADETTISALIAQITISDASISIQDTPRGVNAQLNDLSILSSNTNVENRPFPFEISFHIADRNGGPDAQVQIASTATVDLDRGNARLDDLSVKLNPLQLSGNLVVNNFDDALAFSGALSSNTFALSDFMDRYISAPSQAPLTVPGQIDDQSDQFSMQVSFNGSANEVTVPILILALNDMQANADAYYRVGLAGNPAELRYNIVANALDLNRYTQSTAPQGEVPEDRAAEDPVATASPEPRQDVELPIDLIRGTNVQGTHKIESLAVAGLNFSNVDVDLRVQDGRLIVTVAPMGFYNGQISSNISFDAAQYPPRLTSISSVRNMNVAQLSQALPFADFAEGRLNVESVHSMTGRTVNQLLESINGTTSFNLTDNRIDVGIVKQVFSSISVLSPTGTGDLAQQWPDQVTFSTLEGHLILQEGLSQGQQLKINMDNFEISAEGGIDLQAQTFHYDTLLTLFGAPAKQTIPVAELYQGVGWPVVCDASFDAEPSQYCGPDFSKVRDLFIQISQNGVERRVQEAITEKLPEELQESARGLLNRFFRR